MTARNRHPGSLSRLAAFGYALLLVYGTLFPLHGWVAPATDPIRAMFKNGLAHTSWSDLVTNFLVYMPLGLLLMRGLPLFPRCRWCKWASVLLAGTLLSFTLEYLQAYIPGRTPSARDLVLNAIGTGAGAWLALLFKPGGRLELRLRRLRATYIRSGAKANVGLAVLGLWALAQLAPLVPSLDLGNLWHGIKPLFQSLQAPARFSWLQWGEYASGLAALGLLYSSLQKFRYGAIARFLSFAGLVLVLKVPIVGRQLSLESVLGLLAAAFVLWWYARKPVNAGLIPAALLLLLSMALEAIQPGSMPTFRSFNWIPFQSHLSNDLIGILDLLANTWPAFGLAYLSMRRFGTGPGILITGFFGIFFGTLALEWLQQHIPGRSPDITDVIVATLAWTVAWIYVERHSTGVSRGVKAPRHGFAYALPLILAAGTVATSFAVGFHFSASSPLSVPYADRTLPPPEALPEADIPFFRTQHPRLPAPTPDDLAYLRIRHPDYIRSRLRRAKGGKGKLEDVIFSAYAEPGSQDLDLLFERLMKLKMSWRGHQQAKPLALAYDWLYAQWSPAQRKALAKKVVEASNYLIERIRVKQQLSPYNVYLYNSPFQALIATSIAAWKDLPEADLPMRWTADYLKNHVLPVWRQILGTSGGWHEGGEYVGIGIGQAIYQVPAMWRKATGEDLFTSEPGIRGFADFLVYRTRPDGTHMRLGDGSYFTRHVPDRIPLALETGNKAAYSLRCPKPGLPTAWPWGPLSRDDLCDEKAIEALPLQKHFDGLGLVIARSDWSNEATYVTFKAGDNYWSHMHLDQGAFTLFKGGPLAIDSGYYGPGYGSDHRFNYSAQTIAHNVVTVTDPDDTVPQPPKRQNKPPRPIANDGGQRRVGSGWGERAPLDRKEWEEKRETYHTGRIAKYHADDHLVVAVAELTPAYTNRESGKGTFADRTFRVRHYWRTFIYDRKNDLVVVFDDVVSADPAFMKRALVHTMEAPRLIPGGFVVETPAIDPPRRPVRPAGHLEARILFPVDARIRPIGGPGKAFWVDGKNYDEDGKVWQEVSKRKNNAPEPGRWRVEITPPEPREHDRFLMVLIPGKRESPLKIQSLEEKDAIGARILGPERSMELRFPDDREGVIVQVNDIQNTRTLDLTLPRKPLLKPPGFWAHFVAWLRK